MEQRGPAFKRFQSTAIKEARRSIHNLELNTVSKCEKKCIQDKMKH